MSVHSVLPRYTVSFEMQDNHQGADLVAWGSSGRPVELDYLILSYLILQFP